MGMLFLLDQFGLHHYNYFLVMKNVQGGKENEN